MGIFAPLALLGGAPLPVQFSYRPYVVKKRNSVTATAGAVIVQYSGTEQRIHGDGTIPFTIEGATPLEWNALNALYDTPAPVLYVFKGYWAEVLEVYFTTLDQPTVRARVFSISGQLQVIDQTTGITAACQPTTII